jgi:large subunit ribosomal protein LP0
LNIRPFSYGLVVTTVYDNGELFDAKVLDITDAVIIEKIQAAARNIAAISF